MKPGPPGSFCAQLKALREAAGYTQEELATIAGLSVHAVSALERGERRRPHVDTLRALSAALDLSGPTRDALLASARAPAHVEGLLRQLTCDLLISTVGSRDLPARQQTMNATVAWSYQLLDPEEQRVFRRFGVLPGLFPIDRHRAGVPPVQLLKDIDRV